MPILKAETKSSINCFSNLKFSDLTLLDESAIKTRSNRAVETQGAELAKVVMRKRRKRRRKRRRRRKNRWHFLQV